MRSRNAALVARDPAIPGLAVVLDGAAFAAALRSALPAAGILAAQPTYVRYKPGANCTVAYRITTTAGTTPAYARAYAAPLRDKLDHARQLADYPGALGPAACVIAPLDLAIYSWPHDHALPALRRIADDRKRRKLIAAAAPEHPALQQATVRTLRYKPERRYVGMLKAANGMRAIVRLYAPDEYASARRAAQTLPLGLRTPHLLAANADAQMLLLEWLAGQTLAALLAAHPTRVTLAATAGAALATFHQAPLPDLPVNDPRAALEPAVNAITAIAPEHQQRAAHLAAAVDTALSATCAPRCLIHGDLYADQQLMHRNTVALIDVDNAALGDPAADLGSWIAHRYRAEGDPAVVQHQAAAFLDGYRTAGELPEGVAAYVAAHLLRLAVEPFRYCAPDWPDQLHRLLDRAEEYLHHAPLAV
jgi:hypothetical protein